MLGGMKSPLCRPSTGAVLILALICAACRNLQGERGPAAHLEGRVHHVERIALPPQAELWVRLVEPAPLGAPGARGGPLGEVHRTDIGQSPFDFRLGYDPRAVQPGRVLRLEAEIRVGDEVWFHGARSVAGLAAGPPDEPLELRVHRRSAP